MDLFTQMDLRLLGVITVLIFLAAIAIGAGTLSYFLQAQRSKNESQSSTNKGDQDKEASDQQAPPATREPSLQPEDYMPARPGEVMRVLRDKTSGALVIEVEGKRYRRLAEIRDGRIGRRVLWAIADLLRFAEEVPLENVARTSPAATPASTPATTPEAATAAAPAPATKPQAPPEVEEAFLRRLQEGELTEEKKEPAKPTGFGLLRRKAAKPSPEPAEPRTFVDEIEDILQEFIRESVVPVEKSAHVHTGPDGTLQIEVDGRTYERPDDVPDPIIRGLIKAAVDEWERR